MHDLNLRQIALSLTLLGVFAGRTVAEEVAPAVPAAPVEEPKVEKLVGYDKGFYIQSPDERFKLKMGGYIQGLLSGQVNEGPNNEVDSFSVRRARLKWSGHLFTKNVEYSLEYDFASNSMKTTYLQLIHSDPFKVRVGQFKVPYNFEALSSSSTLQFVDRSIVHANFRFLDERDVGLGFNGAVGQEGKLLYELAMMNGEGPNTLNGNNEFLYAGRLMYNIAGKHPYEFSDSEESELLNLALGAAGFYNDQAIVATGPEQKVTGLTGDLSAKYQGWSFHGAYLFRNSNPDLPGTSVHENGILGQVGYFVVPKVFEVAARVGQVFEEAGPDRAEYTLGLNYSIHKGHAVKFQVDYSLLTAEDGIAPGNDAIGHRGRAQLQVKI